MIGVVLVQKSIHFGRVVEPDVTGSCYSAALSRSLALLFIFPHWFAWAGHEPDSDR